MHRRALFQLLTVAPLLHACSRSASPASDTVGSVGNTFPALNKPKQYWQGKVSPAAYAVLFNEETERPFSSPLDKEKRKGTFICAACNLPLFDSASKFESGTGWPSFTQPIARHVATRQDFQLLFPRTEYHCARCTGHQGHVFQDGPPPLRSRYCNNGLALAFLQQGDALPALVS